MRCKSCINEISEGEYCSDCSDDPCPSCQPQKAEREEIKKPERYIQNLGNWIFNISTVGRSRQEKAERAWRGIKDWHNQLESDHAKTKEALKVAVEERDIAVKALEEIESIKNGVKSRLPRILIEIASEALTKIKENN